MRLARGNTRSAVFSDLLSGRPYSKQRIAMSTNQIEGGNRALLGFYYQMLVTLGVSVLNTLSVEHPAPDLCNLIIGADLNTAQSRLVFPEILGQDIAILSGSIQFLVQAKHSNNVNENPIGFSDLRDILSNFGRSYVEAQNSKLPTADWFCIVTNRRLDGLAPEMSAIIKKCREHAILSPLASVDSPQISHDSILWSQEQVEYDGKAYSVTDVVRHWLTVIKRKNTTNPSKITNISPTQAEVDAVINILPRIVILENASINYWRDQLRQMGKEFGLFDQEIDEAEQKLLGKMLVNTALPFAVTKDIMVSAFTGYKEALLLTPSSMGTNCAKMWRVETKENHTRREWLITRRLSRFADAVVSRNIIFIVGRGGCGKSVFLAQIAEEPINQLENQGQFQGYVAADSCHDVQLGWLENKVGTWAKRGLYGMESLDNPIARIRIANPLAKRLIWINLDGLDERYPKNVDLKSLITTARSNAEVCLVFTCRQDSLDRVLYSIYRTQTGMPYNINEDNDVEQILIDDFDIGEMLEAIQQGISYDARSRLEQAIGSTSSNAYDRSALSSVATSSSVNAINETIDGILLNSLRHPRMLGAFVDCVRSKKTTFEEAFRGDEQAMLEISRTFLRLFLNKYDSRKIERSLPEVPLFIEILREVSNQFRDRPFISNDWRNISHGCLLSRSHSDLLLDEAYTGGLFDKDGDNRYVWRHPFLTDCIINDEIGKFWIG